MVAFGGDPCYESIEGCSDGRRAGWIVYVGGIEAKSCREERDSDVWLVGVQHSGRNGPQQRLDMWTGHASVLLGICSVLLGIYVQLFRTWFGVCGVGVPPEESPEESSISMF